jgi:nucleoside-diphosphate-sugar epimerase
MKHQVKKVFIAGGTGFLGYYSALLFLKQGCEVATIALPEEIDLDAWYPSEIDVRFGNLFEQSEDEIFALLKEIQADTFVYALGPDDRTTPKAPSYDFFHLRLVEHCLKICRAAKRAGVKRCIVLNSYFTHFDRLQNGALSKVHPYIRCRAEQAAAIDSLGEDGIFDVMMMELPYIFGAMPGRMPIWKSIFLDRFAKLPAFYFPDGGTAAVHVTGVAEAIVAAAYNGTNGGKYPVVSENIRYRDMIGYMLASAGINKKFVKMPLWLCALSGMLIIVEEKVKGLQSGLHPRLVMTQLLSNNLFLDPDETKQRLNYAELGFTDSVSCWKGIQEAMQRCYPATFQEVPLPF